MDESLFLSMYKGLLSAIPAAYSGGYISACVFHCYLAATRYTGILIWRARNMENITIRMLRLPDVMAITGLSRAAIYAKCNPKDKARFDPDFPQRVQLSANTVAWPSDRLQAWLDKRIAASHAAHDTSAADKGGKGAR
jgi:hypothetical protein